MRPPSHEMCVTWLLATFGHNFFCRWYDHIRKSCTTTSPLLLRAPDLCIVQRRRALTGTDRAYLRVAHPGRALRQHVREMAAQCRRGKPDAVAPRPSPAQTPPSQPPDPLDAAGTSWILPAGAANCRLTWFCPASPGSLFRPSPDPNCRKVCVKHSPRARGRAAGDGRTTRHRQRRWQHQRTLSAAGGRAATTAAEEHSTRSSPSAAHATAGTVG